jgi:hypothetical protein
MLEKEYAFYKDHKKELLKDHENQFVVIKNAKVLGFYDDRIQAVRATVKTESLGTFLVHKVLKEEEVHRFTSRVYV